MNSTANTLALLLALVLSFAEGGKTAHSCLDESGKPVDWWMALKAPSGGHYYYLDAKAPGAFKRSKHDMVKEKGAVIDTLKQLYTADAKHDAWAVYNDNTEEGHQLSSHAHAKGMVVFGEKQGFWMVHSLPKYPARRSTGYQGLPTDKFGQSYLCMTLPTKEFDAVGKQLQTYWVQTYDSNLPASMAKTLPAFKQFLTGKELKGAGTDTNRQAITTVGGVAFESFAKGRKWEKDLYDDWVNEELHSGLIVESWQNGKGSTGSSCALKYPVQNLQETKMSDGQTWTISQDHSKWAVTTDSKKPFACIGGINRQISQRHRGGGTVCLNNKAVHTAFTKGVIGKAEPCGTVHSAVSRRLTAMMERARAEAVEGDIHD